MILRQRHARLSLLLLAFTLVASASPTSIWVVNIDNSPAPPPELSPPFSRHASRDHDRLKYEIIAIVGAYVVSVLFIGVALRTFGRRWRLAAQMSQSTLGMEMVKPALRSLRPSPISPSESTRNWNKWTGGGKAKSVHSPAQSSASFDPQILEADKLKRQLEMERLYAVVMEEDTQKSPQESMAEAYRRQEQDSIYSAAMAHEAKSPKHVSVESTEIDPVTGQVVSIHRSESASSRSFSQRRPPPRVDTGAAAALPMHASVQPQSPRTPVRAIYPPHIQTLHEHTSPATRSREQFPNGGSLRTVEISQALPASPRSPRDGHTRSLSSSSSRSKRARSIRDLTISAPMPVPVPTTATQNRYPSSGNDTDDIEASRPLSPRFYHPGAPPSPPNNMANSPLQRSPVEDDDDVLDEDIIDAYGYEGLDQPRPLPATAPQRYVPALPVITTVTAPHDNRQNYGVNVNSNTSRFASSAGTSGTLPFRSLNLLNTQNPSIANTTTTTNPYATSNTLPLHSSTLSPGPLKTTFLSPRNDRFQPNIHSAMSANGGGMRSALAVPYSPYMPRTPMTPVAPRLVNRAERRQRQREDGRRVVTREDEVKDDRELWGDDW